MGSIRDLGSIVDHKGSIRINKGSKRDRGAKIDTSRHLQKWRSILIGKNHTRTPRGACGRSMVKAMSTLIGKNHTFGRRPGGVRVLLAVIFGVVLPPVTRGSA